MGFKLNLKTKITHYIIHTINTPANLYKLTVFSQLLDELRVQTLVHTSAKQSYQSRMRGRSALHAS